MYACFTYLLYIYIYIYVWKCTYNTRGDNRTIVACMANASLKTAPIHRRNIGVLCLFSVSPIVLLQAVTAAAVEEKKGAAAAKKKEKDDTQIMKVACWASGALEAPVFAFRQALNNHHGPNGYERKVAELLLSRATAMLEAARVMQEDKDTVMAFAKADIAKVIKEVVATTRTDACAACVYIYLYIYIYIYINVSTCGDNR